MVDRTEPSRSDEHDRRTPAREQLDLQKVARKRHQKTAGALDDNRPVLRQHGRIGQAFEVDFDTVALGGEMR